LISLPPFTATQTTDASCTEPFTFTYSLTEAAASEILELSDTSKPTITVKSIGQQQQLTFTMVGTLPSGEHTGQSVTVKLVHNMAAPYFEDVSQMGDMELQVKKEANRVLPVPRDDDDDEIRVSVEVGEATDIF
jgi:hypothetical protein